MKDYKITKIWATEVAHRSEETDLQIEYYEREIERYKEADDSEYAIERIEELQEQINCLKWVLNIINSPFKIKK